MGRCNGPKGRRRIDEATIQCCFMRDGFRKWWPWCKAFLALAILIAIGRQLLRDLRRPDLWQYSIQLDWLFACGLLYLAGLGFSAVFWYRLLTLLGQQPAFLAAMRAYYVGHLGKHLPGKAWALLLRTTLIHGPDVRLGVAGLS